MNEVYVYTIHHDDKPRGTGRARTNPNGGRPFTPAATRTYAAQVRGQIERQLPIVGPGVPLPTGVAVEMSIVAGFPVPKSWPKDKRDRALAGLIRPTVKPDFDQIEKLIADCMTGLVYADDMQIVSSGVLKLYVASPRTVVTIRAKDNR